MRVIALAVALAVCACGGESDSDPPDARTPTDAGSGADATADAPPATSDGPPAAAGFGAIAGCGALAPELTTATPSSFVSHIEFDRLFDTKADADELTAGGQEIIADGNAGGSSLLSEVFAFELLARCDGATLLKTETEVVYDTPGKITDLLVELDGAKLGVSVTRAVAFPFDDPYVTSQAADLLDRKLSDILESSANVSAADRWTKQALAVLAYGPGHADALATAYASLTPEVRADTILWVIVTDGTDDFIYCDGPCTP